MKKTNVLIIEDSKEQQLILKNALGMEYTLSIASSSEEAQALMEKVNFDFFLVDISLPGQSGVDFCTELRSHNKYQRTPLILLTGKDSIQDKLIGLESGADDYITKPFNFLELKARIRCQLRKTKNSSSDLNVPGLLIDQSSQQVFCQKSHTILELTRIEYKLLICFAQRIGHVLTRQQILDIVWTDKLNVTERTVDSHLSNLRKKLSGSSVAIQAVHGFGYKLITDKN